VPAPPDDLDPDALFQAGPYRAYFDRVVLRPTRKITPALSPARLLRDLFGLPVADAMSRAAGRDLVRGFRPDQHGLPPNVSFDPKTGRCRVPAVGLTLVGHFLTADFYRFFGREFLEGVLDPADGGLDVSDGKLLAFRDPARPFGRGGPVMEYARLQDGRLFEVRVTTRDTALPFGVAGLDGLCRAFLGVPKSKALSEKEKADMPRTFRERPRAAYGYGIADAVNTLLVHEQMGHRDRQLFQDVGLAGGPAPPLRSTLGSRVADFLARTARRHAEGSQRLAGAALADLLRDGGAGLLVRHPAASRFGAQTGQVHGGLVFSRTPDKLWHEAPGQLRDVDMAGCYSAITADINVYWGRPVVYDPGDRAMTLRDAVRLVRGLTDDGWMVRVTGDITAIANGLIPSTEDALTSDNFRTRRRRRAAAGDSGRGKAKARLYSATVRSGVVTHATWAVIGALPGPLRREYEGLRAESLVFYPRALAARGGPEFDSLQATYAGDGLPWETVLRGMRLVTTESIDAAYVTLRFNLGDLARRFAALRREAQRSEGRGGGADMAYKQQANTLFGVLASPHKVTNNIVAANVITARARAGAFALVLALNGFQVNTDGCSYRRDQIPACTLAECLRRCPDYPVSRAGDGCGVPFLDPATIPEDTEGFARWYGEHVRRFFGGAGPEFDALVATHALEHKKIASTGSAAFDALACDGCANYLKALRDGTGGWSVGEFAARSYGRESKRAVQDWVLRTYPQDRVTELPPVSQDTVLLRHAEAVGRARAALKSGLPAALVPLGMEYQPVKSYKAIKASAFVFKTPEQRKAVVRQIERFEGRTGCGLELLALRRSYAGRREGSLTDVGGEVERVVRSGGHDLTKRLNLNRLDRLTDVAVDRQGAIAGLREQARAELQAAMDVRNAPRVALATGRVLTADGRPYVAEYKSRAAEGRGAKPRSDGSARPSAARRRPRREQARPVHR
jgi:hypothetical protein